MDFDVIDAQGSAAIFADGGKSAVLIMPNGSRWPIQVFVDYETYVSPADFDNFSTEQRLTVSAVLNDLPNRERAPKGSIFAVGGDRYIVDHDDSNAIQDATLAVHNVRRADG